MIPVTCPQCRHAAKVPTTCGDHGISCPKCRTTIAVFDVELVKRPATCVDGEVREVAAFCHLIGVLMVLAVPPLVVLVIWLTRRHTMPFAGRHAKEALNFQISVLLLLLGILGCGYALGSWLPEIAGWSWAVAGFVLAAAAGLALWGGWTAHQGRYLGYPITLRLVR